MYTYGNTGKKGRAVVYARRSHWDEGVSLSVQAQVANARRQGELIGFTIYDEDIFIDDGISGMTDDRPGYQSLMLKLFSPERLHKAVIVNDIGRLSRSSGGYIDHEELFAEAGIQLVSLMDPPGNPESKIDTNRRMKAVMNEAHVVDAALKTRSSQMLAVEVGFYIGWVAPFGYRKRKEMWRGEEHTKLEPDPETWHHLLHIIDMAKNNRTLTQIRRYLESTGLRHPAEGIPNKKKGGKRGTGRWTNLNISDLLKSLAMLGWTSRGGENSGTKILHKSEQVVCRNAHEAAMDWDDRELILRNLASRAPNVQSPRSIASPNPMSGLVVCGLCGATMRMHTEEGKRRLICGNKRDHSKGEPDWCINGMVSLDILLERTTEAILGHILTPKVMRGQVGLVAEENRKLAALEQSRREPIEKRIKQLDKELSNFMSIIAERGGSSGRTISREVDQREEEKELLERQLKQIDDKLKDKLVFINDQERIVENALDLRTYLESEDPHDLTQMFNSLIRKVSILNRVATLYYSVPLPRNQTADPVLMERLNLGKKTCPSIGSTGLKAVPVTEGGVLYDLAREMRNCLASYVPRCVEGGTRIFAFYTVEGKELEEAGQEDGREYGESGVDPGGVEDGPGQVEPGQREPRLRLSGAGELRRAGRDFREVTWRVGQVEGSRGSRMPGPEVLRGMDEIGRLYQAPRLRRARDSPCEALRGP